MELKEEIQCYSAHHAKMAWQRAFNSPDTIEAFSAPISNKPYFPKLIIRLWLLFDKKQINDQGDDCILKFKEEIENHFHILSHDNKPIFIRHLQKELATYTKPGWLLTKIKNRKKKIQTYNFLKYFKLYKGNFSQFVDRLKKEMESNNDKTTQASFNDGKDDPPTKSLPVLGQKEYALLCAIEGKSITDYNIEPTKHQVQHCNKFQKRLYRLEVLPEWSKTEALNKLKRYDRIIPFLKSEEARKKALEEKEIIENNIKETHFEK